MSGSGRATTCESEGNGHRAGGCSPVGGGGKASAGLRPGSGADGNKTEQCHSGGRRGYEQRAVSRRARTDPWAKRMIPLESPLRGNRTAGSVSGERKRSHARD